MNKLIENVLLSNASCLGFNWIYDTLYLSTYAKDNDMLMQLPNDEIYENAKPSYNVYPGAKLGSLTFQGNILKWLYKAWKHNDELTRSEYRELVYQAIKPGGSYYGYVESFGKKLVFEMLNNQLKITDKEMKHQDDQLVGFGPYILSKILNKTNEEAENLAFAFTDNKDYLKLYEFLDNLIGVTDKDLKVKTINKYLNLLPEGYQDNITSSLSMSNTKYFIKKHASIACGIEGAIPLIIHLFFKHDNLYEALKDNVSLGGASSDRALLLALLFKNDKLPDSWYNLIEI